MTKRRVIRWAMVLIALLSVVSLIDSYFHDVWARQWIGTQTLLAVGRKPGVVMVWLMFGLSPDMGPQEPFTFDYLATQGSRSVWGDDPPSLEAPGVSIYFDPNRKGTVIDALVISHALFTGVLIALACLTWWLTRVPREPHQCPACGYDLRGLAGDAACPECGAAKSGG